MLYTAQPQIQISSDMFYFLLKDQIWKFSEDIEYLSQPVAVPQT